MTTSSKVRPGSGIQERPAGRLKSHSIGMAAALFLFSSATANAEWLNSYSTARQLAAQRKQPICLYFRTASAPGCQNFEARVLARPAIGSALAGFILVYLDPARHETLAEKFGVYRVPAVVLVNAEGTMLYREQAGLAADTLLQALTLHGVPFQPSGNALPKATPTAVEAVPLAPEGNSEIVTMPVPEAARLKPIRVRARAAEAEELRLRFRMRGEKDYLNIPMRKLPQQGWWEGEIPGWIVTPKGVEYYLSGQQGGQTITVPPEPHRKPFGVRVH